MRGSVANVFKTISTTLRSQRLQYSEGDETDPTKSGQWFYDGTDLDKFVGVFMSSVEELEDNKMMAPTGIVPAGHVVVAVYYYP